MTILPFNISSSPNPDHSLSSSSDSSLIHEQTKSVSRISQHSVFIASITGNSITPEAPRGIYWTNVLTNTKVPGVPYLDSEMRDSERNTVLQDDQ
jgi:hypothetical protein